MIFGWVLFLVLVAFVAGVVAGLLWRESIDLFLGKDDPVRLLRRTHNVLDAAAGHRTAVATWAIVLAMVLPAIVGVGLIVQRTDTNRLVRCLTNYNVQSGQARDDRLAAQDVAAKAEIRNVRDGLRYQRVFRKTLRSEHITTGAIVAIVDKRIQSTEKYLETLQHQQHVRAEHDYPPPNLCD